MKTASCADKTKIEAVEQQGILSTQGNNCFAIMKTTLTKLSIVVLMSLVVSSTDGAGDVYSKFLGNHKPNPEPVSYPPAVDYFAPPIGLSTSGNAAPIVYDATKTAGPGESVACIGYNITEDTRFFIYAQTTAGNGVTLDCEVLKLDSPTKAVIILPELQRGIAPWSTYFLFLKNKSGTSQPVLINRTRAWWVGPEKVVAGQTTSIHGLNLAHDNATDASWVYLQTPGGGGQWATVNSVNPYRVQFTVPAALSNGTYEVWVHNGHGGEYGWSKSPNPLQVYAGPGWTATQFNVKSHGAKGDGITDDTTAINGVIAMAAANPGSTVYFPAGTYKTSGSLTMSSRMRFLGEGMTNSIIKGAGTITIMVLARNLDTVEIKGLKLDSSQVTRPGAAYERVGCVDFFGSSNVWLTKVELYCSKNKEFQPAIPKGFFDEGAPFGVGWDWNFTNNPNGGLPKRGFVKGSNIYLTGCKITGFIEGGNMASIRQVFIDECDFYGRFKSDAVISGFNLCDLSITHSTGQDFDSSGYDDPSSTNTAWVNRFINEATGGQKYVDGGYTIGAANQYIANNQAEGGPHRNARDKNKGEMILFESPHGTIMGTPTGADATHVVFSKSLTTEFQQGHVVISQGKGEGQVRKITGYDSATKTVTIDGPWDVIPDALTSYCTVYVGYSHVAVYANALRGHDNWKALATASSAVSMYSSTTDGFIFAGNTATNTRHGFSNNSHWWPSNIECATVMNVMFLNNMNYGGGGFALVNRDYDKSGAGNDKLTSFGNIVRNNVCDNGSISITSAYACGINIFEKNRVLNGPGINMRSAGTQRGVFINNDFKGTGTAVNFNNNVAYDVELINNHYSGYSTIYGGFPPGHILELPYRSLELTSTTPVAIMQVRNSGTSAMNWTATDAATWLSLSSTSGTVAAESASSGITVTCNPNVLATGTYKGVITITAGAQTKTVGVAFTVGGVSNVKVKAPSQANP